MTEKQFKFTSDDQVARSRGHPVTPSTCFPRIEEEKSVGIAACRETIGKAARATKIAYEGRHYEAMKIFIDRHRLANNDTHIRDRRGAEQFRV